MSIGVSGETYTAVSIVDNSWELPGSVFTTPLADGVYDVTATATDALGNVGTDTTSNELEVNSTELLVRVDELLTNDGTPELTGKVSNP